ncbi:hypothetical protein BH11MYX3_BH11MYX3_32010 [soil metagenome]
MPAIAIGLAVTAVLLATVAVVVVIRRGVPDLATIERTPLPASRKVAAVDVAELERNVVEPASENGGVIGVKVIDPSVRNMLGLGPGDVITAISGRPVRRQLDIYDVLLGASTVHSTSLFVDLIHDGEPALVRWELDGDLREARHPGPLLSAPSLRPVRDPLLDTIRQIDDHHLTVPRATIEQVAGSPTAFAQGARVYPMIRGGRSSGIRVFVVRPTSALYALGLRSGDKLLAVNGVAIDDPTQLQQIYDSVKAAATLRISIERRGTPEVIEIRQTP